MNWKKVLATIFVLIVIFCLGVITYLWPHQYPEEWDKLELGMTREEVHKIVPTIDKGWLDVKGFEALGKGDKWRYWTLRVFYDEGFQVRRIDKVYRNIKIGLFNQERSLY